MKPLTTTDDDGKDWVAVGFLPVNGHMVWVPSDTEIVVSPLVEEDDAPPSPGKPTLHVVGDEA